MKKNLALFLSAVLAGIAISLGATIYLRLMGTFPGSNIFACFFFSFGLLVICTRGYALYTGRACYIFDHPIPSYCGQLGIIWLGNFAGCMLTAFLESLTTMFGAEGINAAATVIVANKSQASYLSFFILGLICNIFIFVAVNAYANNPHTLGKYIMIFFGVMCFLLAFTEHSVADMYLWAVSGELYANPLPSLARIVVVSLGNTVGAVSFPLLEKWKKHLEAEA